MSSLFGFNKLPFVNTGTIYYLKSYFIVLVIATIASTPICKNIVNKLKEKSKLKNFIDVLEIIYILGLLILVTAFLIDSSFNPFLYFRF